VQPTPFKVFPQFNQPALAALANTKARVGASCLSVFSGPGLANAIVRELAQARAIHLKEVLESFEFHRRVRKRLRSPQMADLCCGHGLTGLLFATERQVERVTMVDLKRPQSFDVALDCVARVMPEVRNKVRFLAADLEDAATKLAPGTSCVAVHACGSATDRCIDVALATGGAVAVMGCCYNKIRQRGAPAVAKALGLHLATDVHRTNRLHAAGYQVDWSSIPEAITPMNRVVVGWRP